jgi:membrane-bound lytic murein transglycosylase D
MRRLLVIFALLLPWPAPGATQEALFPRPPALEPRVQFWMRVYSEVGTEGGLLHDSADLGVVYEVLRYPGLTGRSFQREVEEAKDDTAAILRRLARGVRDGLGPDEQRVLGAWPPGVSDDTLAAAAKRVRFQLGQADKFRAGVARSGAWEPYIRGVLEEHGLPPELAAIPHVESSFNPAAHSHVGASGIWQFMRSTGRRFMRVDHVLDERRDPLLSSVAAARLLRENYETTGTWPLAITAYNHGAAGMKRAVQRLGTRDIATIVERYESRSFGFASKNFYAEFLAALEVSQEAERFFGPMDRHPPADPEIVVLDAHYDAATLASAFGVSIDVLREYNAALLSPVWQGQKYVPARYGLRLPRSATRPPGAVVLAGLAPGERFAAQKPDRHYRVHRGDTLSRIADRFDVSERELVALNGLRSKHQIVVGQLLRLPTRDDAPPAPSVAQLEPGRAGEPRPASGVYRVQRGDSLSSIARRHGVSERDLMALNKIRDRHHLVAGRLLQIPGGNRPPEPSPPGETLRYTVRSGDTLSGIASRHGVPPKEILSLNRLADGNHLRAGQTLLLPAREAPAPPVVAKAKTEAAATTQVAQAPPVPEEPAPRVAALEPARSEPPPTAEAAAPAEPAQTGPVPAETAATPATTSEPAAKSAARPAAAEPSSEPTAGQAHAAPAPEPVPALLEQAAATPARSEPAELRIEVDLPPVASVRANPDAGADLPGTQAEAPPPLDTARFAVGADATIRVEPEETLGHYADWLEIPTHQLRSLNGLRSDAALALGRRVRLDFARVPQQRFEKRRLAFHRAIHTDFFRAHRVAGTEDYVLERGDTLWILSQRKLSVPVWLLSAYNPDVDFAGPLRVGQRLRVPLVAPRDV